MRSDLIIKRIFVILISIAYICCGYYSIHMQKNYKSVSNESAFTSQKELSDSPLSAEASLFNIMETKRVPGFLDYTVSRNGIVMSYNRKTAQIMKPFMADNGYLRVALFNNERKEYRKFPVHRLVAEAFIPNPLNLPQVNHEDCDKTNNNDWNLEWCTCQYNIIHGIRMGMRNAPNGEDQWMHKLTEADVLQIRELVKVKGCNQSQIARSFGVTQSNVHCIAIRKSWKYL